MGMTPGGTQGSTGMNFLKGGLTGLSQGLAQYNNPHPVFDFSQLAEGFRAKRAALGKGATPNAAQGNGLNTNSNWDGDPDENEKYLP
jgi:hypothetical protein